MSDFFAKGVKLHAQNESKVVFVSAVNFNNFLFMLVIVNIEFEIRIPNQFVLTCNFFHVEMKVADQTIEFKLSN